MDGAIVGKDVRHLIGRSRGRGVHSRVSMAWGRRIVLVVGVICLLTGVWLAGRIAVFYARSAIVGGEKIHAVVATSTGRHWPRGVLGLLRVPDIGLVAPVEQGTGTSVLDVAVGHLATSVMPGQPGTSVVAAHNVSWFSGLGGLHRGDIIEVDTPTSQQVYRVAWHKVVKVGAPVANTRSPSIVLEACWPLNALYLTPHRYLVGATLVSTVHTAIPPKIPGQQHFTPVGIPQPIARQNLSLTGNDLPMGSFAITGSPSSAWAGSSAPYSLASAEVNWMIALLHAAKARSASELEAVTSQPIKVILPLVHGYSGFVSLANLTEDVVGTHAIGGSASVILKTAAGQVGVTEHFSVIDAGVHLVSVQVMAR